MEELFSMIGILCKKRGIIKEVDLTSNTHVQSIRKMFDYLHQLADSLSNEEHKIRLLTCVSENAEGKVRLSSSHHFRFFVRMKGLAL